MALLQISEPTPKKNQQQRFAVGIDLGTTNSLIATLHNQQPTLFRDSKNSALLPSVVRYQTDAAPEVGEAAQQQAANDPANTIVSVKRLMGRSSNDMIRLAGQLPYHFVGDNQNMPKIATAAGDISPVQVSADILRALKQRAESASQKTIEGAVITVPAYFDDAQRQATKDAALLAGLPVLRLLSEPTAAAIAYGLDQQETGLHLIYDLGGGTFDVSLLRLHQGIFEVIATGGDSALGGDDMDHVIAEWILTQAHWKQPLTLHEQRALLTLARHLKEQLSGINTINVEWKHWSGQLTRQTYEQLITPLIEKTLKICRNVLKDCHLSADEINAVILVGGATRTPLLQQQLTTLFHKTPLSHLNPDEVVAIGAAIQANILIGNQANQNLLLLDVLPLSLGLETMGGLTEKIIERNTPIPATQSQQFTTYKDNQTAMVIHVVQGERELVQDCRSLARFELTGIPPMKAGAARIEVIFQVDADGLLSVSAKELSTQISTKIEIKPSYGLTESEVKQMLEAAYKHAKTDIALRELTSKQVEAQQLLDVLTQALAEDGKKYLDADEEAELNQAMHQLQDLIHSTDLAALHQAIEQVDQASQVFARRRMDATLKTALVGKTIEDISDANN